MTAYGVVGLGASGAPALEALDRPGASRAVGGANGSNPVPIIVPCHRVITSAGGLGGFGGGLDRKRWLLDFEGARGVALGLPLRA